MELRTLVIKSSEWLRGKQASGEGLLYNGEKKHAYCCLGLLGRECGIGLRRLKDRDTPDELVDRSEKDKKGQLPDGMQWLVNTKGHDSRDCISAMNHNDNGNISDTARLKRLTPIFLRNGWQLEFVNDEEAA